MARAKSKPRAMPEAATTPAGPFLAVDIGNTSTKCGFFIGGQLQWTLANPTKSPETLIKLLEARWGTRGPKGWWAGIGSVVPAAVTEVESALKGAGAGSVVVLGRDRPIPIENDTKKPEQVGQDRLLAALGGLMKVDTPFAVVDVGTAITVDGVNVDGVFVGGAIAPGLEMMAEALHAFTARLPRVDPTKRPPRVGQTTEEAIRAGVRGFAQGGVLYLIDRLESEIQDVNIVVLTGGGASMIKPELYGYWHQMPDVVLEGIHAACHLDGPPKPLWLRNAPQIKSVPRRAK